MCIYDAVISALASGGIKADDNMFWCTHNLALLRSTLLTQLFSIPLLDRAGQLLPLVKSPHHYWNGCGETNSSTLELLGQDHPPCKQKTNKKYKASNFTFPTHLQTLHSYVPTHTALYAPTSRTHNSQFQKE